MANALLGALALAFIPSAFAFRNSSPFFLFSTANLNIHSNAEIARAATISNQISRSLKSCPSTTYVIVRQDGVTSNDYLDSRSAPRLSHYMGRQSDNIRTSFAVPEVVGDFDSDSLAEELASTCNAELVKIDTSNGVRGPSRSALKNPNQARVFDVRFSAPPNTNRAKVLDQYDAALQEIINVGSDDYTVIYTTTAQTEQQAANYQAPHAYQMDDPFDEAVHMELKRDTGLHKRAAKNEGALFERYQYLSPGLFMGFAASIPLVLILYVGIMAISSVEVSYFAFSKEMGPTAQKKQ